MMSGNLLRSGFGKTILGTVLGVILGTCGAAAQQQPKRLELRPGEKIILVGNTLAERMQYFGYFETLLHSRFPKHRLVVRNLGWSADELTVQLRSKDFQDHGHTLRDHKPDVVLAFLGSMSRLLAPKG